MNPVYIVEATFTPANLSNQVNLNNRLKVTKRFFLFFFKLNSRLKDTQSFTFKILQWHSCVMLHDKHMDHCHAKGLLCLNRRINDACVLTSTLPTGTLRSVSMHLISSIFLCYYFDSPLQMTNRLSSLQKYSQAAAQSAAALISHSFLGAAASSRVASRLLTGTKKAIISPQFGAACSAFLSASGHVFKFCGLFLRFKMVLQLCISLNSMFTRHLRHWGEQIIYCSMCQKDPKQNATKLLLLLQSSGITYYCMLHLLHLSYFMFFKPVQKTHSSTSKTFSCRNCICFLFFVFFSVTACIFLWESHAYY